MKLPDISEMNADFVRYVDSLAHQHEMDDYEEGRALVAYILDSVDNGDLFINAEELGKAQEILKAYDRQEDIEEGDDFYKIFDTFREIPPERKTVDAVLHARTRFFEELHRVTERGFELMESRQVLELAGDVSGMDDEEIDSFDASYEFIFKKGDEEFTAYCYVRMGINMWEGGENSAVGLKLAMENPSSEEPNFSR